MNKDFYAWSAGIFEGEGTGGIWKGGVNGIQPTIRVEMNDKKVLKELQLVFSGSLFPDMSGRKPIGKYNYNKIMWRWQITHRLALHFALTIFPYMKGRKREILMKIIEYYDVISRYQA